jgi:integrase
MERIIGTAEGQMRNLIRFAFWTGLRTSELIGLEWGDMDCEKWTVRVQRAFVSGQVKETKTKGSARTVVLFPEAMRALEEQKEHSFLEGGRIFRHPLSSLPWKQPQQIEKFWKTILKRAGVPFRNPYQTRHTYASMLLSAGENPMFVASQMGHASWAMIARVYGKWIPENAPGSGDKIRGVWSQFGHKAKDERS